MGEETEEGGAFSSAAVGVSPSKYLYNFEEDQEEVQDADTSGNEHTNDEENQEESTTSRALRTPLQPTQKMIDDHSISHVPFREWCSACVRGRGKSVRHKLVDKSEDLYPVISVDYGFFGTQDDPLSKDIGSSKLPILVVKDRRSKRIWSHPVPEKGADNPYAYQCLVRDLEETGYKRVCLKEDQEPAIKAVAKAAATAWCGEVVPENSPMRESKSNGEVERAVQEVQGLARTLKEALEQRLQSEIKPKMAILAWLVEYVGTIYSLFQLGRDGMTPFQRLKGRTWKIELPEFGETVEFMKRTKHKLSPKWEQGIYIGVKVNTSERIVGTRTGIFVVQSVRRKPKSERWNRQLVEDLWGLPWKLRAKDEAEEEEVPEMPGEVNINPEVPEVPNEETRAHDHEKQSKRTYLTKSDFAKYGYTKGCSACAAIAGGIGRTGIPHSEECRKRVEEKLKDDPKGKERLSATEEKEMEKIAKEIEKNEKEKIAKATADQKRSQGESRLETPGGSSSSGMPDAKKRRSSHEEHGSGGSQGEFRFETPGGSERTEEQEAMKRRQEQVEEVETLQGKRMKGDPEELLSLYDKWDPIDDIEERIQEAIQEINQISAVEDWKRNPERPVSEEPSSVEDAGWNIGEWETFYDTITGEVLESEKVKLSMKEELDYMNSLQVWRQVERKDIPAGTKIIPTKWVLTTKDEGVRARLVACEVKGYAASEASLFVSTPPLDALRAMIALAACDCSMSLDFLDIRKAHLNGISSRLVAIKLPKEAGSGVAILERTLYGTRDAAAAWERCISDVMMKLSFKQGVGYPSLYWNEAKGMRVLVHGDDFVVLGSRKDILWFRKALFQKWDVKERGCLGYETKRLQILGRWISRGRDGYEFEADPKHAKILIQCASFKANTKGVSTPGEKGAYTGDEEVKLEGGNIKDYRSRCMRGSYLALDRPDLMYSVKESSRKMSNPCEADVGKLDRIARYLIKQPRVVQKFPWQCLPEILKIECDSDHAGCSVTRKSTTGYVGMLGECTIAARSVSQSILSLSSAESEFYALCSAASAALGLKSLFEDLGVQLRIEIGMDASAAISMASRRGLGKAKHIQCQYLWIQKHVQDGNITIAKIGTDQNRADLLTKNLAAPKMKALMIRMGFVFESVGLSQNELPLDD